MDIHDTKEQRQAFDEWHYNQYLLENPNIDISNAKYIYDYAHKNVLVWQIRESHFTAWQAAKAQAIPDGFVVVPKEPTQELLNKMQDFFVGAFENGLTGGQSIHCAYIAIIDEAQEQTNDK